MIIFLGVIIPHLDNRGWKNIILEINQHLCESKNKTLMQFSADLESERHFIVSERLVVHIATHTAKTENVFVTIDGNLKFHENVTEFLVSKGNYE